MPNGEFSPRPGPLADVLDTLKGTIEMTSIVRGSDVLDEGEIESIVNHYHLTEHGIIAAGVVARGELRRETERANDPKEIY